MSATDAGQGRIEFIRRQSHIEARGFCVDQFAVDQLGYYLLLQEKLLLRRKVINIRIVHPQLTVKLFKTHTAGANRYQRGGGH